MYILKVATLALSLAVPTSAPAPIAPAAAAVSTPLTWKVDVAHSDLSFSVRHMLSRVRGQFSDWTATITADSADWSTASVEVIVQTKSITTNQPRRDEHLRSAEFFEADKYPTITFKSTKVERTGNDIKVTGNLTMHGVTKPLVLTGKFLGMSKKKSGKLAAAFDLAGTIKRSEFEITWNRAVEGGMLVGDDVTLEISVAANQM